MVDDTDTDTDTDIDNSWVDSYKASENNYNEFYNEKVTTIKGFYIYINYIPEAQTRVLGPFFPHFLIASTTAAVPSTRDLIHTQ